MAPDNELLIELYRLRAELKDQGKAETGRTPLVCTDDALEGIAELRPKTVSDFGAVPGIGSSFMENYAPAFLEVIDRYRPVSESAVAMDASVSKVMKELEKKLVSLNRRNRMLYLPKIVERYSFDISYLPDLYGLLFSGKEVVLGDPRTGDLEDESRYRRAVKVIRDAEKDLRDKGQNDLYVAYPFVKGRLSGEDFDVRAPLALFPVKAVRGGDVRLRIDPSRDPVYNSVLILAQQKFTGISKPLPDCTIDDAVAGTFIADLSAFYRDNGLELKDDLGDVDGFRSYLADQFPRYAMGELHIERCAVLGKFPSCTSAVQRDFETMLEEGMVNSLLKDLLSKAEDLDFRSDGPSEPMRMEEPREEDLFYINRLDASQENVLSALSRLDSLVVQGPPGSGKTNTILNTVITAFFNNKTVLISSYNNHPVDEIFEKLSQLEYRNFVIPFPVVRLGNKDYVRKAIQHIRRLYEQTKSMTVYDAALSKKHSFEEQRNKDLNDLLHRYEQKLDLEERKAMIEALLSSSTNMPMMYNLQTRQLQEVKQQLSEIGDVRDEDVQPLIQTDLREFKMYLNYTSAKYIKHLSEPKYKELLDIVYMDDADEQYTAFTKYLSQDANMQKFLKVFPVVVTTNISAHRLGEPKPYFDMVIIEANKRLAKMTENRYELVRKEEPEKISDKVGLDLEVKDNYTGKKRDVKSLSGGEAFKAALSLALGLSDIIQSYSGGVVVDTLFIDEGFGSLDTESREQAINTLSLLIDNNKLIGIISHVTELKERIDKKIIVTKTNDGSKIETVV